MPYEASPSSSPASQSSSSSPPPLPSPPSIFDETTVTTETTEPTAFDGSCSVGSSDEPQCKKVKSALPPQGQPKRAPRGQAKRPSAAAKPWRCPHPGCDKVLLGPNSHNVNKHVLKMHPTSPVILRCSMCSDFRTMRQDELESHTRSCLGRTAPMPTLPMGAPVISLPSSAVVAETAPEPSAEPPQEVVMVGDVAVLPLVRPPSASSSASANVLRMLTVEEIDQAVESYVVWRGQVGSTEHERVVKKAIIDTPVKRTKLRTLLRRIFATAAGLVPDLFAVDLDIRLLVDVEVVQALFQHQETHRLRGARVSSGQPSTADVDEACIPAGVNEGRFTGGAGQTLLPQVSVAALTPQVPGIALPPQAWAALPSTSSATSCERSSFSSCLVSRGWPVGCSSPSSIPPITSSPRLLGTWVNAGSASSAIECASVTTTNAS